MKRKGLSELEAANQRLGGRGKVYTEHEAAKLENRRKKKG
jgi:hypothetical protein